MRTLALRPPAFALAVLTGAVLATGCGEAGSGNPDAEVSAVATTTQLADFVSQVGGGRVAVEQILEPNADPHSYEPRPSDAGAIADADVVLRSGGDLDEWLMELIDSAGGDAPVIEVIDAVESRGDDPHWWQDPRNADKAVATIRERLAEADPDGSDVYERNAAAYIERLRRLDSSVARCIDRIPRGDRKLVTTHDALGYYADRYGLEVIGALIPSLSTQAQPSSKDIGALVDQIDELGVKAIFPESSVNPKLEEAVGRETGAEVGEALWADTLGAEGSSGATYIESIQSNTAAIVDGLTGGAVQCRPRV